ncbi:MAG: hypothetical protein U0837_07080 [Dehalococcoidia bacterium]|jgi:hypothetical protein
MELETLVQERMEQVERELLGQRQLAEAMRVGAVRTSGPREWFDQVLIRASRGAERRQAARIGTKSEPVL